jgi:hypothetical protein
MPNKPSIPDQFSDDEMEQMKRYGSAQLGGTDFSAEVEKELDKLQRGREASAAKMHAAQTSGGDTGLGPSDIDKAQIKQRDASQQQTATQGAQAAAQAQGAQAPVNAPAAPTGPAGVSAPYPAQRAPQPPPSATQGLPPQAPAAPGPEEDEEQGPPQ